MDEILVVDAERVARGKWVGTIIFGSAKLWVYWGNNDTDTFKSRAEALRGAKLTCKNMGKQCVVGKAG